MNQKQKEDRWSTQVNTGGKSTQRLMQKAAMESTNSDDGDYDLDERGNINASGGVDNFQGGDKEMEGDTSGNGANINMSHIAEAGGEEDEQENAEGGNEDEHNIEEDDDEDEEGSDDVSSPGDVDRNSDPGVHVHAESDYLLPPTYNSQQPNEGGVSPDDNIMGTNLAGGGMAMQTMGLPPNPLPHASGESVSLGTATQTHEVRMPMLLSTFKPATGCTNASDFIVRCFVARLRSGITVVKHGRSRWCKSRLRVLHVHPDGRSLSWKPALGEPSSGKRPPKLDLTSCKEVRHAWSPDPDNPMFTGTPILRQKCEAANAHKSFALIFPKRTVDITAVTADQCKVLMEGFSALCFRLQVAQNVASSGNQTAAGQTDGAKQAGEGLEGIDKAATESVTLTNTSLKQDSPKKKGGKMRSFRS